MKKYIALFLLLSGSVYFSSCSDSLLDPYTPGALDGDLVITNPQELERLMNTTYSIITDVNEITWNTTFTDESAIGYANGGQGVGDELTWLVNQNSSSPNGLWSTHYVALAYLNRIIGFTNTLTPTTPADQQLLRRLRAEALTLRAYSHNVLITYFSPNPKDASALGVILADRIFPVNTVGTRVSNGEIYASIDADLQEAADLYNTIPAADSSNPTLANRNFTTALKARSLALRGDYPNALIAAQFVIDNSGLQLADFSNYTSVFHTDTNANNNEVIFKLKQYNGGIRVGAIWASVNPTVTGSPFYEMGRTLFNDLNTTDDATATPITVTAALQQPTGQATILTVPGHTLQVNDMVVFNESRPLGAQMGLNGTSTQPANSLVAGKVYFVKTISGDNITLTDTAFGTVNVGFGTTATAAGIAAINNNPVQGFSNDADIRYATLVAPTSIIRADYQTVTDYRNTDKIAFRKYPGTTLNGQLVNDIKVCRLSEMYLIKAEALVSAGDLTGAAVVMKQLRDKRFNRLQDQPVYASATDAWKDILLERKKEFAAEGFRYVDLKRLGALAGEVGIDRYDRDCLMASGACDMPLTDYRFTLPIPVAELDPNPTIEQNPGYN